MYLSGFKDSPYLMVEPDSILDKIDPDFLKNKYTVRVFGKHDKDFIIHFTEIFKDVEYLDIGMQYGVKNEFVYNFPKLKGLVISLYKDVDFVLDCNLLPKTLKQLHLYTYTKNKIVGIEALNNNLEQLTISDFNEKDLTKLSALTNLKSLSFATAKIKSLKGIENLKNLKVLSLGGVRSLTDISDIKHLHNLKYLEFDICWKLQDFSPISNLQELESLKLLDCKNVSDIQFVKQMLNLKELSALGTTVINDFDTTPAEHIPVVFLNENKKYNKHYPEKEIKEQVISASRYL